VAWWPTIASRGANVLRDLAGSANGVLDTGASWVNNAMLGHGIDLNGTTSGKITIPHNANQNTATFSVSAWVRWDSSSSSWGAVFFKTVSDDDSPGKWDIGLMIYDDGDVASAAGQLGTAFQQFDTNLVSGSLHHLALTCAGAGQTLTTYLDGIALSPTKTAGSTFESTRDILIGNSHDDANKRPLNGAVWDVRFNAYCLSPPVIWQMAHPPTMWNLYRPQRRYWTVGIPVAWQMDPVMMVV